MLLWWQWLLILEGAPGYNHASSWLTTVWIAYILSRADHRKSPVQTWAETLKHTLETFVGQPIRPVEFGDDRLTSVLKRLADPAFTGRAPAAVVDGARRSEADLAAQAASLRDKLGAG